jgi:uncharacterized protein (DUF58 family)
MGTPNLSQISHSDLLEVEAVARTLDFRSRKKMFSPLVGNQSSFVRGSGLEFDELRNYSEGDDVRRIAWKVSARTTEPQTALYREEHELQTIIVLDQKLSMETGTGVRSKAQFLNLVALLLSFATVSSGGSVALLSSGKELSLLQKGRGRLHRGRVLKFITSQGKEFGAPVKTNSTSINGALHFLAQGVKRNALVFILSDFSELDLLSLPRHDTRAIIIEDPLECGEIPSARFSLYDPVHKKNITVDGRTEKLRESLREKLLVAQKEREKKLQNLGYKVSHLRTDTPIQKLVGIFS